MEYLAERGQIGSTATSVLDDGNEPRIELSLLGAFGLHIDRRPIDLPGAAQRVLAFLALEDRPVRRERLAASLWTDFPEERAGANLRAALWRLRRQGADVVRVEKRQAWLSPAVEVDLRAATRWAWRVIDRGAATEDLDQAPALDQLLVDWYDDWVVLERERLRQIRLHALEAVCAGLIRSGRYARAIDAAFALVELDPLRERPHRLVVEAHLREGSWGEARRAHRAYAHRMRDELGIEVSDRLTDFVPDDLARELTHLF